MKYTLRVIDFETTGIPDEESQHSVVEAAYVDINAENRTKVKNFTSFVKPSTPMSIEALATHHISEKNANEKGILWDDCCGILLEKDHDEEIIYVAHNADFEKKFFDPRDVKWIDTYKVALKLYPDAPGYSNQILKYYLGVHDCPTDHHPPHRALPDCEVTACIILRMGFEVSFNEMIKISKEPPYLTKMTFGKHKGERFEDIPMDYLKWVLRQSDIDEGVIAAINRVLLTN